MLNDGFGDSLSPTELIEMHTGIAHTIAWERQTSDAPYEDLVQEAKILIWKLAERGDSRNQNLRGLASVAIRRRSQELVARQTWTGYESRHGRPTDPLRNTARSSADAMMEEMGVEVFGAQDALEGVEMAYHEGQIMQALQALPEAHRAYVVLRFWGQWTQPEIAKEMGVSVSAANNWWERSIKPALRRELAHLGS